MLWELTEIMHIKLSTSVLAYRKGFIKANYVGSDHGGGEEVVVLLELAVIATAVVRE